MSRFSSIRRWRAGWRRVSPLDRTVLVLLVVCLAWRIIAAVVGHLPLQTFAGFFAAGAAVYFIFRLIAWIRARLLWRLRSRLIIAYLLFAVVPLVLVAAMIVLGSYLLYLQIGAHLLQDELNQRITAIATDTDAITGAIQHEAEQGADPRDRAILEQPRVASLIAADQAEWPGFHVLLNRGEHLLRRSPDGRNFSGLTEYRNHLAFTAAETRDVPGGTINVEVIAFLNSGTLDSFNDALGPISLMLVASGPEARAEASDLPVFELPQGAGPTIRSVRRALPPAAHWFDFPMHGLSTFEAYPFAGRRGNTATATVVATFVFRPFAISNNLLESVGKVGPFLVAVLIAVAAVFLVVEIIALIIGVVLTRTITGAVADLYEATLHVRRGDFTYRVHRKHQDQLAALGDSFNEMTSSISELIEGQRRHQRLENEVEIAREVQEQLFPRELPSAPGLQLAAICRPARVVSGDYYDFIRLGPTRIAMALADISGKGISAALLMASLQAALRSAAMLDGAGGTAALVARLNQHLFRNSSDDRYATLFYAVYDTAMKTLTYTNAGHLPPFFVSGGKMQLLDEGGTVVGLFDDAQYHQGTITVAPGSLLVAFSDGLTEPQNVYGEEFGVNRLREEVLRESNDPASAIAENLVAATERWAGTPEQADDMTVVVARMD